MHGLFLIFFNCFNIFVWNSRLHMFYRWLGQSELDVETWVDQKGVTHVRLTEKKNNWSGEGATLRPNLEPH